MDYAMPAAWGQDSRGFWTKRKRSALSLMTAISLVSGIAVAFKLFDKSVPNNVVRDASTFQYEVWKRDANVGDTTFFNTAGCSSAQIECTSTYGPKPVFAANVDQYPGDERVVDVKLINTNVPERDASFYVYIKDISVTGCVDGAGNAQSCENATPTNIPSGTVAHNHFVAFWTFTVDKQDVFHGGGRDINADDHGLGERSANQRPDDHEMRQYVRACSGGLKSFVPGAACDLGRVRAKGARDAAGARTDQRYYLFKLQELDDLSDQSRFKGWTVTFSLVFQARVPAVAEVASAGRRS
ncbi:MAG TPA: hypothetical protein VM840_09320 [Actinomycetota bacterium]|jgi:hypothetical protein|nr:hypothetical protein [Actinomycetota bacterium]